MKTRFLQRRYATRLGKRYVSAAVSVILLGFCSSSRLEKIDSVVAQIPSQQQQTLPYE